MKFRVALCALLTAVAAQVSAKSPVKVGTGSRVPSLTIKATSYGENDFHFTIQNSSGNGVTAFELLLVPSGVPRKNGHYVCQGRCISKATLGDIDSPAIAAGGTKEVIYPTSDLEGSAIIIEAAVFDNGTYGGSERTSALLVAAQLGYQVEFDRIVGPLNRVISGSLPSDLKGGQVDSTVAGLSVETDPDELAAFERWFPNVRDCDRRFSRIMQLASASLKTNTQLRLQRLLRQGTPSDSNLDNWWKSTQQWLAKFGCKGCASRLEAPSPPARTRTVSVGCGTSSGSGSAGSNDGSNNNSTASNNSGDDPQPASPDDTNGDSPDQDGQQTAQNDPDPDDSAGTDAGDEQLAMTEEVSPEAAAEAAASTAPPVVTVPPPTTPAAIGAMAIPAASGTGGSFVIGSRCRPQAPRPIGALMSVSLPEGDPGTERRRGAVVTDDQLYRRYFAYVREWERCFADGQWPASTVEEYPKPYPESFNSDQREIVRTVADDWLNTEREAMKQRNASISTSATEGTATSPLASLAHPPATWAEALEQEQARRDRLYGPSGLEDRTQQTESRLNSLRLGLGKAAFNALNTYAYGLYAATPGRLVHEPLPERVMILRYVARIGLMDKFAGNDNDDGRAAVKALYFEQKAAGLSDEDELKLQETANTLRDMSARLRTRPIARPGEPTSGRAIPVGDPRTDEARGIPALNREEMVQLREARETLLQKNLSQAGYEKVVKRVHELYDTEWTRRLVPVEQEPEPAAKPAKIADAVPSKQ